MGLPVCAVHSPETLNCVLSEIDTLQMMFRKLNVRDYCCRLT